MVQWAQVWLLPRWSETLSAFLCCAQDRVMELYPHAQFRKMSLHTDPRALTLQPIWWWLDSLVRPHMHSPAQVENLLRCFWWLLLCCLKFRGGLDFFCKDVGLNLQGNRMTLPVQNETLKLVIFRLVWDFGGRLFDLFLEPFLGAKKSPFFNPQSSTKPTGKLPPQICWFMWSLHIWE